MSLVLSLFPGIGLLDRGFEAEGFCVVRGPDLLWGGDVKVFHPPAGRFEGVIGGPPCQAHSQLRHLVEHNGYRIAEDLVPEFLRCVKQAQPDWWLMENVPGCPDPECDGYDVQRLEFDNRWCGGVQSRRRIFWFGHYDSERLKPRVPVFENAEWAPAVLASGGARAQPVRLGGSGKPKRSRARELGRDTAESFARLCELQGLPEGFNLPGFLVREKIRAVGNGVPFPLARTIAQAVREAVS